jgi:hypothetical protein
MKTLFISTLIVLACSSTAMAGMRCYYIGQTQYCDSDDGSSYTGNRIGNDTWWTGRNSDGSTTQQHCYYIGQTMYCN